METEQNQSEMSPEIAPKGFFARWSLILGIVIAVVAGFGIYKFTHQSSQNAMQFPGGGGSSRSGSGPGGRAGGSPTAVTTATVTKDDISVRIPALGTITPLATVTVKTQINGQLQKIAFVEGQSVKVGEFLAQIDPRPYQAALTQAEANLHRDQALLANAKLDLQRYASLLKEESIAQQQLDTQKALVLQYDGTIEGDQAQVHTAALNLAYTHIVSPIAGRVGLRQVDQGNFVTAGDTNGIVVITQLQPISALFSIPEDNIPTILRGLHGATLTVAAFDRSHSHKLANGKLATMDNQIDINTGTFKLRALFDNTDGALFPNQFVNLELLVEVLHDQLIVPNSALHRGAPNGIASSFVYLVAGSGTNAKVNVRAVTLGAIDGERVAITAGLSAGDVVVTEGGDRLRDGSTVMLPTGTLSSQPHLGSHHHERPRP